MAIFKKKLPIDQELTKKLKEVLTTGVEKDEINKSDTIAGNLYAVLQTNKTELTKMFDNNYDGFKAFLLAGVQAVRDYYIELVAKIPTTNIDLRQALWVEANETASKMFDNTRAFIEELTMEKVSAMDAGKTERSASATAKLEELKNEVAELQFNEVVQKFTNKYLSICAASHSDASKDPIFMDTTKGEYTPDKLTAFIEATGDADLQVLYDSIKTEDKEKFAKAVFVQVNDHEKALKKGKTLTEAQKGYTASVDNAQTEIEQATAKVESARVDLETAEEKITECVNNYALLHGCVDGINAAADIVEKFTVVIEKIKSLKDAAGATPSQKADYAEHLRDITGYVVDYLDAHHAHEIAKGELAVAEARKLAETARKIGITEFNNYDVAEKARLSSMPERS